MLRNISDLESYSIGATDGVVGDVKDFYFDDEVWVIRYLIVEAGAWLASRRVLISPVAVGHPDGAAKVLSVSITKEQVKNSPDIDTAKPVSRAHEMRHLEYYRYPYYWEAGGPTTSGVYPNAMSTGGYSGAAAQYRLDEASSLRTDSAAAAGGHEKEDHHLRSCNEVMKYHIHATDGDIGHVQGLILDDASWAIRYIVVQTSNWWLGRQVIIEPQHIDNVSWPDEEVSVDLTRNALKSAMSYDGHPDRLSAVELLRKSSHG